MIQFDFTGKHVLVTGASRGIGYAIARGFAHANAELSILADDPAIYDAADMLSTEFKQPVLALQCDITERQAVADNIGKLDQLDVLINNAGLELITPIDDPDADIENTFRRIIDINVMGTYYVTREALAKNSPGWKNCVHCIDVGQNCSSRIQCLLCIKTRQHWLYAVSGTGTGAAWHQCKCCLPRLG